MKLSELSRRDYIAIEVLGHFANKMLDKQAVWRAYGLADAMIAYEGQPKRDHEFEEMKTEAARLRTSNEILQGVLNEGDGFAARVALTQIWEFLGVTNQTAAMQMLRDAFPELGA